MKILKDKDFSKKETEWTWLFSNLLRTFKILIMKTNTYFVKPDEDLVLKETQF
jgi:hypothetical protein